MNFIGITTTILVEIIIRKNRKESRLTAVIDGVFNGVKKVTIFELSDM